MIVEIIKEIPSFPGYQVSNLGNVYFGDKTLRIGKTFDGYPRASLRHGRRWHQMPVHRLVCEAFNGPKPSPKHEVAHNDGNRTNCHPSNLRWATRKENLADAIKHGTHVRGENHKRVKLTDKQVETIRKEYSREKKNGAALARKYGVGKTLICNIVNRKRRTIPTNGRHSTTTKGQGE